MWHRAYPTKLQAAGVAGVSLLLSEKQLSCGNYLLPTRGAEALVPGGGQSEEPFMINQ